jgi:hypothetical protein
MQAQSASIARSLLAIDKAAVSIALGFLPWGELRLAVSASARHGKRFTGGRRRDMATGAIQFGLLPMPVGYQSSISSLRRWVNCGTYRRNDRKSGFSAPRNWLEKRAFSISNLTRAPTTTFVPPPSAGSSKPVLVPPALANQLPNDIPLFFTMSYDLAGYGQRG